jgi:hypothetical protein
MQKDRFNDVRATWGRDESWFGAPERGDRG